MPKLQRLHRWSLCIDNGCNNAANQHQGIFDNIRYDCNIAYCISKARAKIKSSFFSLNQSPIAANGLYFVWRYQLLDNMFCTIINKKYIKYKIW